MGVELGGTRPAGRSRSPGPRGPRVYTPMEGNINISISPAGQPMATLTHPSGASCKVLIGQACVLSWRTAEGCEHIAACEDADCAVLGGLSPIGVPKPTWDIENLQGVGLGGEAVTLSVFSEGVVEGDVSAAARVTFSLLPKQLSVDLEVANTTEVPEGQEATKQLSLACGLRGHCLLREGAPQAEAPANAEDALRPLNLKPRLLGFTAASLIGCPAGLQEKTGGGCVSLEAATQGDCSLEAGQALTGGLALQLID
eukprot:TRINITY_DN65003_c0_g1_i1.p1 TRINITY_DN65003_c0_g1~~TRINITY_DN65003_c0_g1_i1.p1  ORF type:complete len:256 (-),score=54.47 TRINITY_DN65003_c0_g1_i1:57-824(-)